MICVFVLQQALAESSLSAASAGLNLSKDEKAAVAKASAMDLSSDEKSAAEQAVTLPAAAIAYTRALLAHAGRLQALFASKCDDEPGMSLFLSSCLVSLATGSSRNQDKQIRCSRSRCFRWLEFLVFGRNTLLILTSALLRTDLRVAAHWAGLLRLSSALCDALESPFTALAFSTEQAATVASLLISGATLRSLNVRCPVLNLDFIVLAWNANSIFLIHCFWSFLLPTQVHSLLVCDVPAERSQAQACRDANDELLSAIHAGRILSARVHNSSQFASLSDALRCSALLAADLCVARCGQHAQSPLFDVFARLQRG